MAQVRDRTPVRDHAARLVRFQRIEIDATRLVLSGIALALPVAVGAATGHVAEGLTAVMGALLVSSAGHEGGWRARCVDLGATAAVGALVVWLGAVLGAQGGVAGVWIVAVAFAAALVGGIGTLEARIAANATVFTVIGAHLGTGPESPRHILLYVVLGMAAAAALTLGTHALGRALSPLRRRELEGPPGPEWPFRRSVPKWRAGLRTWHGWQYAVRLTASMAVAEVVAQFRPGAHAYWIALTVSLVVLRDEAAAPMRALERGLGTTIGVLVGGGLIGVLPTWGIVALIGVIGAVRPYLKLANYTAYAAVMTPLITMLNELGDDISWAVLRERVLDTLIGCAVGLCVGYLPWRMWSSRQR
ncbi:hypothetical protein ABH926_004826 [Catenulispora sp. GP43]